MTPQGGQVLVVSMTLALAAGAWDVRAVEKYRADIAARARASHPEAGAACPLAQKAAANPARVPPRTPVTSNHQQGSRS